MSTSSYPQESNLRLEIEQPAGAGLRNLIVNPVATGFEGGWGWKTDPFSTGVPETTAGTLFLPGRLRLSATGDADASTTDYDITIASVPFAVSPGQYVAAYLNRIGSSNVVGNIAVDLTFLDVTGALVAGGPSGSYAPAATGAFNLAATVVPAAATSGILRIRAALSASTAGYVDVSLVTVAQAATAAALAGLGFVDQSPTYTDVIGSSLAATITRNGFDVATLQATIKDVTLDPAVVDLIRPGRRCKLSVQLAAGDWVGLFYGKIDAAPTIYDLAETDESKRATITLHALDDLAILANTSAPNGYATLSQLTSILERVAVVPWRVNDSTAHVADQAPIITNPEATALDQIIVTRDSLHAYAWMSLDGRLWIADTAHLSTSSITLDESVYSSEGPVVTWDTDEVINEITLTHIVRNSITGETTQVTWGPYQDLDSVRTWGVRHRDITVQGLTNNDGTMRAYANAVFATNADPAVRVKSVDCPIKSPPDGNSVALRNLYDLVRVTNAASGLDEYARVTSITHEISPGSWRVALGFGVDGGSPVGQTASTTPAIPSGPATVGITVPEKPHTERTKTVSQSLAASTEAVISWDAAAVVNAGGITVAGNVFTVPRAGRYLVTTYVSFGANATGRRDVFIRKNGALVYKNLAAPAPSGAVAVALSAALYANAGDTIQISAQQTTTAALSVPDAYLAITYLD